VLEASKIQAEITTGKSYISQGAIDNMKRQKSMANAEDLDLTNDDPNQSGISGLRKRS